MVHIKFNCVINSMDFILVGYEQILYSQNLPSKSFPSKSYENSCSISATFCPRSPAVKGIKWSTLHINIWFLSSISIFYIVLRSADWVKLSIPWTSVELELQVSPLSSSLDCLSHIVSSSSMMSFYLTFACCISNEIGYFTTMSLGRCIKLVHYPDGIITFPPNLKEFFKFVLKNILPSCHFISIRL